jgi:hypothetical protein
MSLPTAVCVSAIAHHSTALATAAGVSRGAADGAALVEAPAAELLLWLYGRVPLDTQAVSEDLLGRFRAMCFTD